MDQVHVADGVFIFWRRAVWMEAEGQMNLDSGGEQIRAGTDTSINVQDESGKSYQCKKSRRSRPVVDKCQTSCLKELIVLISEYATFISMVLYLCEAEFVVVALTKFTM